MDLSFWKSRIAEVSYDGLLSLAKDAEQRIGSHVAGGDPTPGYVEKQQGLLLIIQDEISKRE